MCQSIDNGSARFPLNALQFCSVPEGVPIKTKGLFSCYTQFLVNFVRRAFVALEWDWNHQCWSGNREATIFSTDLGQIQATALEVLHLISCPLNHSVSPYPCKNDFSSIIWDWKWDLYSLAWARPLMFNDDSRISGFQIRNTHNNFATEGYYASLGYVVEGSQSVQLRGGREKWPHERLTNSVYLLFSPWQLLYISPTPQSWVGYGHRDVGRSWGNNYCVA